MCSNRFSIVVYDFPLLLYSGMNFVTRSLMANFPSSYSLITEDRVAETLLKEAMSKIVYWVKGTWESFVK